MAVERIVIIGGGYAGCMAANRLCRATTADQVAITLVNLRPDFVERVRLHQRIAGTHGASVPLVALLNPLVRLRIGEVTNIGDREVVLGNSEVIAFDWLIYAAGGAPTRSTGAYAVGDPEQASLARGQLNSLSDRARVVVVGGGLTGIETAAEIAEQRPLVDVELLSDSDIGASLHPTAARRVQSILEKLGVEVRRGRYTDGVAAPDGVDMVLWAVASEVSDLAVRSGLPVDGAGRLCVDEYLRSVHDERIFAAGDCASVPGQRLSCQTALPQGAHVADTLVRLLSGKQARPYSMGYIGQNISLGRDAALIQTVTRKDKAQRFWVTGRVAVVVKEQVCRAAKGAASTGRYAWLPAPR